MALRRGLLALGIGGGLAGAFVTSDYADAKTKRQVRFWSRAGPLVFDYGWVRFVSGRNDTRSQLRKRYNLLHDKYAPVALDIILDLRGLYVKWGQVCSVRSEIMPPQYMEAFRSLQSDVPGVESEMVKRVIEQDFGVSVEELFESFDDDPVGCASVGQAHIAVLRGTHEKVVVKVQYPDASSLFDADIQSIKLLIRLLEPEALVAFDDFAAQLREELDFRGEVRNLELLHDAVTPVFGDDVVIPEIRSEFCSDRVITMTYISGEKLDRTILKQLAMLADGTAGGVAPGLDKLISGYMGKTDEEEEEEEEEGNNDKTIQKKIDLTRTPIKERAGNSMALRASMRVVKWVGPDAALSIWRGWSWVMDTFTSIFLTTAQIVQTIVPQQLIGTETTEWLAETREQFHRKRVVKEVVKKINCLFDVHAFELFTVGTFNADPHPGNLIATKDGRIGLIDYGQCTTVSMDSRTKVAQLMVAVATDASDEVVADAMRALGVESKKDNSMYLATMARLMFDRIRGEYLDEQWHIKMHTLDRVIVVPKDLGMVARVAGLLRGLALTLQQNVSVADLWEASAQEHLLRVKQQQQQLARK